MLKQERHDMISSLLSERGTVSVKEITNTLSVSEMTVRRDLDELAGQKRLVRVHGGARSIASTKEKTITREFSHLEKRQIHTAEKTSIARRAAGLIEDGDTIFLGTGTTIELMASLLPQRRMRVVTNSLPVFNLLESREEFGLCLIGGTYRPSTGAFVGPMAERSVGMIGIDKAFIGANGILDGTVSTSNMEEGNLQRLVLNNAASRYLLADGSKLGKRDFFCFYELNDLTAVITDGPIDEEAQADIRQYTDILL